MTSPTFLKILSVVSFIISASFTIILMLSGVNGALAIFLTFGCALVLECAKVIFFIKAMCSEHLSLGIRTVIFTISALLFIASIVASLSFMFNQGNETKNISIQNSTEYKQSQENRNMLVNQVKTIEQEKQALIQQADNLPKNYYSFKQSIMDKVATKNIDVVKLNNQIQNTKTNFNVSDTKGYKAFNNKLASMIGTDPENIELIIFGTLSIIFELVAGFLFYISQVESSVNIRGNIGQNSFDNNKVVNLPNYTKKERLIGFKPSNNQIDKEHLQNYVNYMYDTAKDNISQGYKNIGSKINIDIELARKIKGHLEQREIIKTVGNRTVILRDKSDIGLV